MIFTLFAAAIAAAFFASSLVLLNYGRQLGLRYRQEQGAESMAGLPAVEGAVFALIGLLIAFTVSGALQRFDERRQLVLQEANAVSTAFDRLDLIGGEAGKNLQKKLKEYVGARIELYRMPHDFSLWEGAEVWSADQQKKIQDLKTEVWNAAVATCSQSNFHPSCPVVVSAVGTVFEAARMRAGAAEKHPPQVIYAMLFGLGLGGSLLAGFSMAAAKARSWIHMVTFAATLAATLYVITDIEFPRLGFIRIEGFDHFLVDAHDQMRVRN